MATKKFLSLERLTEYDELIKGEIAEGDASSLSSAKSYTNTEIAKITSGTTVVPNATHAVSADTATSATSASQLATARKITLGGDASGNVSFDGTTDVTLTVTVKDDSHAHVISNVDGLQAALDGKASSTHNHDAVYDAIGSADAALASAKSYADSAAATVKNDLLNGAGEAYDTLSELGTLISENVDAIDALETIAAGKADAVHTHAIADITNLQTTLDGKAAKSHGTHVTFDSTNEPKMDGTAAFGTSTSVARADHVHPTDTSRASKTEFDTHAADTTAHITATERTNWGTAYTHSQAAHAPSNAEKNQNAFSNITVGETTVAADTATDTVTFVGSNVTITPDATNDKITFAVASGSTSAAGIVKLTNSTSSTSTTTAATPSSVKSAYDLANTAKTAAATAQATADGKANASHTHTITATAEDDDIVVLSGTNGTNAVTYTASHATSGATAGSYGDSAAQTPAYGGTFKVPYITVNATGHITGISEHTVKIPASDNSDTKVTQTVRTTDGSFPVLLRGTSAGTTTTTTTTSFGAGILANPSTSTLTATKFVGSLEGNATSADTADTATTLTGLTATVAELNYVDGVTSGIQAQLDAKAASGHTHSDATTSAAGFMTAAMVTKLNGIATGANKTTVDTSLSTTSTNPVQNKVVATALNNATSAISANTTSISSHSTAIANLQTAVSEIQEITSEDIQALFASSAAS